MTSLALIELGHCQLAIPHQAIASIENISGAQADDSNSNSYWSLQLGRRSTALYSLDTDLQPQRILNSRDTLALCFKLFPIAITCQHISALPSGRIWPVPAMMQHSSGCIDGLILHLQKLVLKIDLEKFTPRFDLQSSFEPVGITPIAGTTASCNVLPGI